MSKKTKQQTNQYYVTAYTDTGRVAIKLLVVAGDEHTALALFKEKIDPPDTYSYMVTKF